MVKETENLQESGQSVEQRGVGQGGGQGATRQTSVYGNFSAGACRNNVVSTFSAMSKRCCSHRR